MRTRITKEIPIDDWAGTWLAELAKKRRASQHKAGDIQEPRHFSKEFDPHSQESSP